MFKELKKALLTITDQVYHYQALNPEIPYIVWGEDSQGETLYGDGELKKQAIQGTIDYFTKASNDPNFEGIQKALKTEKIPFYLNTIQFEKETGFIHYEWVWEVLP